jgi:hypothetical protein
MKHILNNLTEQEKQAILEQHKGGMKVVNENFSKLIKATLGDAKPLVSEQDDKKDTHRYETGTQTPGIEKFMGNPSDETVSNGLLNQLRNDPFGKGKIVIIFNGEKFKEPGAFMFKIQRDSKSGICYKITSYEYNNRILINTQIKITAEVVECKKTTEPIKISGGTTPIKISGGTGNDQTKPKPKVGCRYKIVVPRRPKTYNGGVSEGSAPGEPYDSEYIRGFQEFCSRKGLWKKDLNNGTTVPCSSKSIDGKWGCCSQTCYNILKKQQPIPRPKPRPGDDEDFKGDTLPSKNIPGSDCPKSVNCMPGPGQRDSICKNPKVLEMCKRLGTKVYY